MIGNVQELCHLRRKVAGFIKDWEFLDKLSNCHFLRKNSTSWIYFYLLHAETQ
jgi:hypothetical protein